VITRDDVRLLLLERRLFAAVSEDLDDDSPVMLDSMSLMWLLHGLNERYHVELSLEECDVTQLTSVGRIHEWVATQLERPADEGADAG
jgi:hypothetical protein